MNTPPGTIFNLVTLTPAYQEVADAIFDGLTALGFQVHANPSTILVGARNVVFGAHLIGDKRSIPADAIIFNLEPLDAPSPFGTEDYLECLRTHAVWDPSPRNVAWLKEQNLNPGARLVPIGYAPRLFNSGRDTEFWNRDPIFF